MAFATKLKRAKGLGNASGYHHWALHRTTGLFNVVLVLWAMFAVATTPMAEYYDMVRFIQQPLHAILLILLVVNAFTHFFLCIQLVVEDYVSGELMKTLSLIGFKILSFAGAVVSVFAIITIYLKGTIS